MKEVKRSFESLFIENASIAGVAENEFEMKKTNLIKQYMDCNGFSRAMVYRHFKKAQTVFKQRKVGTTAMVSLKDKKATKEVRKEEKKETLPPTNPIVDIPKTRQAILMEQDSEKLRAFVLEVLMNHINIFPTVMQGAKKRAEKLHIERKIAQHAREIERLQKELLK